MRGLKVALVVGFGVLSGCQSQAPAISLPAAPPAAVVTVPALRPVFVVQVVPAGMSVKQSVFDSAGNVTLKVPPHLEKYGQQFSRLIASGVDYQEALRQVTAAMNADGVSSADALKQIAQMNPELIAMARLFGYSLPGLTA